jgi:hypothetical protein
MVPDRTIGPQIESGALRCLSNGGALAPVA